MRKDGGYRAICVPWGRLQGKALRLFYSFVEELKLFFFFKMPFSASETNLHHPSLSLLIVGSSSLFILGLTGNAKKGTVPMHCVVNLSVKRYSYLFLWLKTGVRVVKPMTFLQNESPDHVIVSAYCRPPLGDHFRCRLYCQKDLHCQDGKCERFFFLEDDILRGPFWPAFSFETEASEWACAPE